MFNELPDDILVLIINQACSKPSDYLSLRNTNHHLYEMVHNLENLYEKCTDNYENDIHTICKKKTTKKTFEWIFRNKAILSLQNIKELIIHNRYDIFRTGLSYQYFLKLIFNRFYLYVDPQNDIFSLIETKNPLILAGMYNRVGIIQLLLQGGKNMANPYLNIIPSLLDISIKYNHKNVLSYLIINYYDSIDDCIQKKLNTIIHRIHKCEDILFYLMMNKKITLKPKHLNSMITMNYNDFFITYYSIDEPYNDFLQQSITSNNIRIFNYITELHKDKMNPNTFTEYILRGKKLTFDFVYNLVNNYLFLIEKDKPFLKVCIQCDINQDTLISLIKEGYSYDEEDMKVVLEKKDIRLLEVMCHLLNC